MFHVNGDGDSSAVWVAQRVPAGHVAVVTNAYTIRHVNCADTDNFICSKNIFSVARRKNLFHDGDEDNDFDFAKIYGADAANRPGYYVTSRWWRVFSLVAPSVQLATTDDFFYYPFSVKSETVVTESLMEDIMSDHFEGTQWDQTKGVFAGPFGNPNRLEGGAGLLYTKSVLPRAISIPRTNYGVIGQAFSGAKPSVMWLALDSPSSSIYLPFFQGCGQEALDDSVTRGDRAAVDRQSLWWALNLVSNQINLYYSLMNQDVQQTRAAFRRRMHREMGELFGVQERRRENVDRPSVDVDVLAAFSASQQKHMLREWATLHDHLSVKYLDGSWNVPSEGIVGSTFGYPLWFLEMSGADKVFSCPDGRRCMSQHQNEFQLSHLFHNFSEGVLLHDGRYRATLANSFLTSRILSELD